jgi:tetratricopeptide (TPR) repeat protein
VALTRDRRAYAEALGQSFPSQEMDPPPRSAKEHYDLGRSYLRSGLIQQAAIEFQNTLKERPQDFWPNFYQGLCAYQLRQFEEAVAAFRTCIALAPTKAECYHNRAIADEALGRATEAMGDYSRALELDPSLTAAALNRGTLLCNAHRYDDAIADFQRALRTSPDPETTGHIHYNLAVAYLAKRDRSAAAASIEEAVGRGYHKARELRVKLHGGL